MEWVEVHGKTVDVAVQAALAELGVGTTDEVVIEVIREPKAGFLGIGGQEAIVKVTPKPKESGRRRRRRGRGRGKGGSSDTDTRSPQSTSQRGNQTSKSDRRSGTEGRSSGAKRSGGSSPGGGRSKSRSDGRDQRNEAPKRKREATINDANTSEKPEADINEQATVAEEFLTGLLTAFGLEGSVSSRVDDDILYVDVTGGQTEALVGSKGSVMQSVHELTRTVIQRKTYGAPRMRIDIAGYGERRREALRIYAGKLAEKVLDEGGEVMLEPMNAADRKVVHDALVDIDGVRSYSEGTDPNRAVVIALEDGVTPRKAATTEPDDETGEDSASEEE